MEDGVGRQVVYLQPVEVEETSKELRRGEPKRSRNARKTTNSPGDGRGRGSASAMRHRPSDAGGNKPSLAACSSACAVTEDRSHWLFGATILAAREREEQECPMATMAKRRGAQA